MIEYYIRNFLIENQWRKCTLKASSSPLFNFSKYPKTADPGTKPFCG